MGARCAKPLNLVLVMLADQVTTPAAEIPASYYSFELHSLRRCRTCLAKVYLVIISLVSMRALPLGSQKFGFSRIRLEAPVNPQLLALTPLAFHHIYKVLVFAVRRVYTSHSFFRVMIPGCCG
jgi:hypothetical protein